jgi:hypothetical protein
LASRGVQQPAIQIAPARVVVAVQAGVDRHHQALVGLEAQVHPLCPAQALQQQAAGHEQHQADRELGSDEQASQVDAAARRRPHDRLAAQGRHEVGSRRL